MRNRSRQNVVPSAASRCRVRPSLDAERPFPFIPFTFSQRRVPSKRPDFFTAYGEYRGNHCDCRFSVIGSAQTSLRGETYTITRAKGPIVIDGDLSDEGWRDAVRVERWYEINPGDNIEPLVKSVAFLTYDDKFFYAGFEFDDPNPKAILAPYGDHDSIQNNADFGDLFLDTRNGGHTAYEFHFTAHNIQFDAVMDDNGGGENASPDSDRPLW